MIEIDFNGSGTAHFTLNGVKYRAEIVPDDHMGAPWAEHDGHGPVTDWTTRAKTPGERILNEDGASRRFYDHAEAIRIAKRDGWDAAPYTPATAGQRAARAVEADFQRLRAWCNDEWRWVGVVVTARCGCCDAYSGVSAALWGIESDSPDYHADIARKLADGLRDASEAQEGGLT